MNCRVIAQCLSIALIVTNPINLIAQYKAPISILQKKGEAEKILSPDASHWGNGIDCSSCHDQHKQTYPPFLRALNLQNALCKDCHQARNVGSYRNDPNNRGSHPEGIPYPTADTRIHSSPQNPNLPLIDPDQVECTTCHKLHYADSNGANGGTGDGYILRIVNSNALCQACHTYTKHIGQGCEKCHQPHDPDCNNIFLIKNWKTIHKVGTNASFKSLHNPGR